MYIGVRNLLQRSRKLVIMILFIRKVYKDDASIGK